MNSVNTLQKSYLMVKTTKVTFFWVKYNGVISYTINSSDSSGSIYRKKRKQYEYSYKSCTQVNMIKVREDTDVTIVAEVTWLKEVI